MMNFNPILTEINGLSPEAQGALGMAGHAIAQSAATPPPAPGVAPAAAPHPSMAPQDAPPPVAPMRMADANPIPTLGGPPQPSVIAPRGTTEGDTNYRGKLLTEGPAIGQIAHKIEGTGFGQNHPMLGKILGHAAQGAARLGNIALDTASTFVAPGIAHIIPGTDEHHQTQLDQANQAVTQDVTNRQKESESEYQQAEARKTQGDTANQPQQFADTHAQSEATTGNLTSEAKDRDANAATPPLAIAYSHAVNQALKEGRDPSTDPIVQHLSDAITSIQKQPLPKGAEHVNLTDEHGKPMAGSYDPATKVYTDGSGNVIKNPVPYEKPQTVNVNAGDASLDRLAGRLSKPYQTAYDKSSAQLDNVDKTLRSINSGYKGQALALPETLTSLVSGQGTGVRVTMPELQMVGQHNGVKGDIESFLNKISGEGSMTDEDKKQLSGILREARGIMQDKVAIHSNTLDAINGAGDRHEAQEADKLARRQLNAYEKIGALPDRAKHFGTLPDGTRTMSEDGNHWQNMLTGQEVK